MLNSEQIQFTTDWWTRTVKDDQKLLLWLTKLESTEFGGFLDYEHFIYDRFYNQLSPKELKTYFNIGQDELKHSGILLELIENFWACTVTVSKMSQPKPSKYWEYMNRQITDVKTCSAVNYYGEALAAARFEIIMDHIDTPSDIKEALSIILPDEQFHREALFRLAGDEALGKIKVHHDLASEALRTGNWYFNKEEK